jgi:ABC-type transporter MlaC component
VDCSVAGVSFLNNQRAEYESVLKSNDGDIDNFIQLLKLKVESLDKKEGVEAVKL